MDSNEFQSRYTQMRATRRNFYILAGAGVLVGILLISLTNHAVGFIPGLAILIYACIKASQISSAIKELTGPIVEKVLSETFDLISYSPASCISSSDVRTSGLFTGWDSISGSDLVECNYKGVHLQFSDLRLTHESEDSDGNTTTVTDFYGPFFVIKHQGSIHGRIQVKERGFFGKKGLRFKGKKSVETENSAFNQHFNIVADNQEEAFYVLTPSFMEKIERVDGIEKSTTQLCIDSRNVYVGMWNKRNHFEKKSSNVSELEDSYREDVRWIANFLDIFLDQAALFPAAARINAES